MLLKCLVITIESLLKTYDALMKSIFVIFSLLLSQFVIANGTSNILILGDSLSAGYGIQIHQSWPALLQTEIDNKKASFNVHNASISGQTSSEVVRQIDQLLTLTKPALVILEVGANDGLRGLSIGEMKNNLQTIISKSLMAKSKVLLVGIKVPVNYGRRYGEMFNSAFKQLAKDNGIPLIPFMLEPLMKVVNDDNKTLYIQADGLHPTAKAQPLILKHLLPKIGDALGIVF